MFNINKNKDLIHSFSQHMLHIYSMPKSKINMIPSLHSSFYNVIWKLLAAEARSEHTGSTEKAYLSPTSESHKILRTGDAWSEFI